MTDGWNGMISYKGYIIDTRNLSHSLGMDMGAIQRSSRQPWAA